MKLNIEVGALSIFDTPKGGEAVLHTVEKEMKTTMRAFPGAPETGRSPFNVLTIEAEGSKVVVFLSNEQLADVRAAIQEG